MLEDYYTANYNPKRDKILPTKKGELFLFTTMRILSLNF